MKLSKLIKRDWRNWTPPSVPSKRSSSQFSGGYENSKASGIDIKPLKQKPVIVKAVKSKNRVKKAVPTKTQMISLKLNQLRNNANLDDMNYIIKHRHDEHHQENHWSDEFIYFVNDKASYNTFKEHINSKDKRLQSMFARLISKYAEDYAGEATIGEDEWDIDELMLRSITKRNIYNCKQSRDKIDIALVLDSSPSCHKESKLFHTLASLSNKLGNVDIYLAPNARLSHIFNSKTMSYDKLFEDNDDIISVNGHHMHNYFHNRTIFFFGDNDAKV